ncbi:hypothetical protein R1sor_007286 [Riccia sorocarpa]|uniref:Uncharacterized protein n=1 Tax=Riccia sorocarpa TaxID=122646 RepID=A0ABD3HU72_9MARC
MWKEYKLQMIVNSDWQGGGGPRTSGLLKNPGKTFFLKMAAAAVDEVNRQRTKKSGLPDDPDHVPPITYARKAMILCDLFLNTNEQWDEKQLSAGLQTIITRYRSNFMGSREGLASSSDSNAHTVEQQGSGRGEPLGDLEHIFFLVARSRLGLQNAGKCRKKISDSCEQENFPHLTQLHNKSVLDLPSLQNLTVKDKDSV